MFSHRGIVNHVRIRTRNEGGGTKFFLVDPMGFDSLYDLIDYYQHNPLKAAEFEQILTDPVPQVWYPWAKHVRIHTFVFCSPTIITTSSKLMLGFQLDSL